MRIFVLPLLMIGLLLQACSGPMDPEAHALERWLSDNERTKVLCTIGMIGDLVQQIGGDHVDSLTLIEGELDPHTYELVKGDDEKFSFAQVIFYNGLGLEHGPSMRKQLEDNPKAVALGDFIRSQVPDQVIDAGGLPDPHVWMDVELWMIAVPEIVRALSEQAPEHELAFRANANTLMDEMAALNQEVLDTLQTLPEGKRYLVTSHDAFSYFARRYLAENGERTGTGWEKRCEAPEGLAPEGQLSTVDIQRIIDHLQKHNINVLFPESNVSQDSIKKIVDAGREKGLKIRIAECHLYADAMGPKGSSGDSYLKMIRHNALAIAKHLKGDDLE